MESPLKIERPVYDLNKVNSEFSYMKPVKKELKSYIKCQKCNIGNHLYNMIPILKWLPEYSVKNDLPNDLVSGITVAIMNIPQGLAYASLANVSPISGLYMAFFPVLIYCLLGTSRHISIGSFAVVCIMTGNVVTAHGALSHETHANNTINASSSSSYEPIEVATAVTLLVAVMQLCMYLCRLGVISMLLSDTLVSGFTTGAAVHVFTSQVKEILGLSVTRFHGPLNIVYTYVDIFSKITNSNVVALGMSATAIVILVINNEFLKPKLNKVSRIPFPIELVMLILGIITSHYLKLNSSEGLRIVGDIPTGIPEPHIPPFSILPNLIKDCVMIVMVSYTVAMSMALMFAKKLNYKINPNQELLAMGAGNLLGSFFSCLPVSASLSRSLIQEGTGGKTQVAGLTQSSIILVILLWVGPLFEQLPRCVLASIIVVALKSMFLQAKKLPAIWRRSLFDGLLWIVTLLSCVILDIDFGLIIGIVFSVAQIAILGNKPYICVLGKASDTELYFDVEKYQGVKEISGTKIIQYVGVLNYVTHNFFREKVYELSKIDLKNMEPEHSSPVQQEVPEETIEQVQASTKYYGTFKGEGIDNGSYTSDTGERCSDELRVEVEQTEQEQGNDNGSCSNDKEERHSEDLRIEVEQAEQVKFLILDISYVTNIDSSGVSTIREIIEDTSKVNIFCLISGCPGTGTTYETLDQCNFFSDENTHLMFPTVHDAVCYSVEATVTNTTDL